MKNNVCVLIVTYNAEKWLDTCLKPFLKKLPKDFVVVVVDNASTDNTVKIIKSKYKFVKLFVNKENLGFGRANNIGLSYALKHEFKHVLLLNQDASITISELKKLCAVQQKNPQYYVVSPMVYGKDKKYDLHFSEYLKNKGLNIKNMKKHIYNIDFINAAIWLLSNKCLKTVGGFNPSFFHYGEDGNYKDRLHFLGAKIGIVPVAVAHHYHDYTKTPSIYFTDKILSGYRSIVADVSDPNKRWMLVKWYVKLLMKLFLSLISFNVKSVKRNSVLLKKLTMNKKEMLNNKQISVTAGAFL